ncbi:uncharacterized protein LOC142984287 [Anticarsia gemmatalis]|uniref:uncharacterized protein LOC142984287 n=1 Tax=Anticarsia gemmatalis TaxID=129554 RepID=UPI003F7666C7
MKVFVALCLVFACVSGRGSGPYLPSGWKPQGPAFYLPSEVSKPAPAPIVLSVFPETEASGSDALREYGPPKLEESINVNQGLPEVATAQTFAEVKSEEVVAAVEEAVNVEENVEQSAAIVEVSSATESSELVQEINEEATLSAAEPTAQVAEQLVEVSAIQTEEETTPVLEEIVPTNAAEEIAAAVAVDESANAAQEVIVSVEEVVPTAAVQVDNVPSAIEIVLPTASDVVVPLSQQELTVVQETVVESAPGVNNIAEALVNLENEVKAAEVQAIENTAEISSVQESSGSLEQAPEGFLEYGPPGFTEYGPPKQEDLARLAVEVASVSALENNEVRRRRFSPKFRSTKKH